MNLKTLPNCIGILKDLRYLDLSNNGRIKELPRSITRLQSLETLLLNYCSMLRELHKDFWKLTSLRHLELYGCTNLKCMPRGIGQLTNLQTLTFFVFDTSSKPNSARASELGGLKNLRGDLDIKGLECLRRNTMELKGLNLTEMSYLEGLTLIWKGQIDADQDNEMAKDDILLEKLQPPQNLKNLTIDGFCGATISSWVSLFTNLTEISVSRCKRLQNLPPLHQLPHLKIVSLEHLSCLEWIDKDSNYDSLSTFFPSLEKLCLHDLPKLKGWRRCSQKRMAGGHSHVFKNLLYLDISSCPNLILMPLHPYLHSAYLDEVSEKILRQTIKMQTTLLLSNSPLCTLQHLKIRWINDLTSLSGMLQHLTGLRELSIWNCEELDPRHDEDGGSGTGMQWKELNNLHTLYLYNLPKMKSLPGGLQYVTTLETLRIEDCANLIYIPKWIASLRSSLQVFEIDGCGKLTSLPKEMHCLTSLQMLRISRCPQLEKRCRREVGEDWPKISHVPNFLTSCGPNFSYHLR